MDNKDRSHSPIWILCVVGTIAVFCFDAEETWSVFNLKDGYTKTTFDHLRSYGGHLFVDDGINKLFWMIIYATWPIMLLYYVSTFFKQTPKGYLYQEGHMHWSVLLCAVGSMCFHMKWLRDVELKDIGTATFSIAASQLIFLVGFTIKLTVLGKKADAVEGLGFGGDIRIMRFVVINIYDFYVLHVLITLFCTMDAYLISAHNYNPVDSNFYILLVFIILQVYFLYSDLYFTNDRTRYVAGGYITMFVDSFAIMLYQMKTLPNVPLITVITFLISFAMPCIKIYVQSQTPVNVRRKLK